jgi:putative endopeptidase
MDEPTSQKAKQKLSAIRKKVGFPDTWNNYEGLVIRKSEFFNNNVVVSAFNMDTALDTLTRPVDPAQWDMTATTVNAYYSPFRYSENSRCALTVLEMTL